MSFIFLSLPFDVLMGIWDTIINNVILAVFGDAFVDPSHADHGALRIAEVIVIDGSLFYRAIDWTKTGNTWNDWMDAVFARLERLLARFRQAPLRAVVLRIDMYGGDYIIEPLQKQACQARRYVGARALGDPRQLFRADAPVAGINSVDTFGVMENRLAVNAMFTTALIGSADSAAENCYFGRLARQYPGVAFILEGGVGGEPTLAVFKQPVQVYFHEGATHRHPFERPPHALDPVYHSEGDIGLCYWQQVFSSHRVVWHSCDTDLLVVGLYHVRRLAEHLPWSDVPDLWICKQVAATEHWIHLKTLYMLVCSVFGTYNASPEHSHPIDLFTLLMTTCGNDFCEPYGVSSSVRNEGKGCDGVRFPAIWSAYFTHYNAIGELVAPTTEADRAPKLYGAQQVPTYVYPVSVHTARWRALIEAALDMQLNLRPALKCADERSVHDDRYMHAQIARASASVGYYANAALPGYKAPRGVETDQRTGVSVYGWAVDDEDGIVRPTCDVVKTYVHSCVHDADAPTEPPTPQGDALADFEALEALYDMAENAAIASPPQSPTI